jgi:hypothetical protein
MQPAYEKFKLNQKPWRLWASLLMELW